ncbi:hypothetical protein LCGC14_0338440 [marine sediment metagenome]|uniref:Helix-turn-helix domain-containing protein n=1 Tax=marine sediment metagenome TaxID=412755 RepID=A0A0F9TEJ2_9ZZZZ
MKIDPEDLITTIEASRILEVSESTVRGWCDSGKLNVVAIVGGKRRLLDKKEVERFKAERERG